MKNALLILLVFTTPAVADVTIVLGTPSQISWSGGGVNRVASFATYVSRSMRFNGNGNVASGYSTTINGIFSISFWGKVDDASHDSYTFCSAIAPAYANYWLLQHREDNSGLTLNYAIPGVGGWKTTPISNMVAATWYHIVMTLTNMHCHIYQNGVKISDADLTAGTYTSRPLYLGSDGSGSANYLLGNIDEFVVWSRVLTDTDVANLYNAGAGYFMTPSSSMAGSGVLAYHFDETPGTATATDIFTNYNGTVTTATNSTDHVVNP